MVDVFISYSRKDRQFAVRLATSLHTAGAEVWIDVEDIPAGMKWSTAIQEGLKQCQLLLVIISPDSMASNNVEDEWQYFLDHKKPVIPVLLRETEIHFQLSRLQYINFSNQDYDKAWESLHQEIVRQGFGLTPRSDASPAPPPPAPAAARPRRALPVRQMGLILALIVVVAVAAFAANQIFSNRATPTAAALVPSVTSPADTATPDASATSPAALSATNTPAPTSPPSATTGTSATAQTVSESASETRIRQAAFNITAAFEGGNYASYENYDAGIVNYGRFQFTLAGGSLFTVVDRYVSASSSATADELKKSYWLRLKDRDATLRTDTHLKDLLVAAADDPLMQVAQDEVATENIWTQVQEVSIQPRGIETPLGQAFIFDTAVNLSVNNSLYATAEAALGVPTKSHVGENGVTEEQFITKAAEIRRDQLSALADKNSMPGLKVRGDFWVNLITAGDWQLQGDANGNVSVNGSEVQVRNPGGTADVIGTVIGKAGTNMRDAPVTGNVVARLPYLDQVKIIAAQPQPDTNYIWAQIQANEGTGWIRTDFLSISGDGSGFGLSAGDEYPAPMQAGKYWWIRGQYDTQSNGTTDSHIGWDFSANEGEPVYAGPNGGVVAQIFDCTRCTADQPSTVSQGIPLNEASTLSDPTWGYGLGNAVIVLYQNSALPASTQNRLAQMGLSGGDMYCLYAHLASVDVSGTQTLSPNARIGTIGSTGDATGLLLHLECRGALGSQGTMTHDTWVTLDVYDPGILFRR